MSKNKKQTDKTISIVSEMKITKKKENIIFKTKKND